MQQERRLYRFSVGLPYAEYLWVRDKSQKETRSMAGTIVEIVKKAKAEESEEAEKQKA